MQHQNYAEVLERLKNFFPSPVSDPIMDGYFVHSVSRFLDMVDSLKTEIPLLSKPKDEIHYQDSQKGVFPDQIRSIEDMTSLIAEYCQGMVIWSHPNAQANVVPPATIASITAFLACAIYKPNMVTDDYSGRFTEAEIRSVAMVSDLIGYDSQKSTGVFTFGGTGTILYGCRIGIEKALHGQSMKMGVREDVKIFTSDVSHYSNLSVVAWLGVGTNNLVKVATTKNNEMSLDDLEIALRASLEKKEKIAAIITTMGTTDAFGLDDVGAIVKLRDRLVKEFKLDYVPHVHADAVIGWAWSVFRDYKFKANKLGFHARTIRSLQDSLGRLDNLHLADSIGVDFHKTGYTPYTSSMVIIKDRSDLSFLSRAPEQMPYLYQYGHYHPGIFTLECSRSGTSALAALANMQLLGKQGYRVLIGHCVEMTEMLRERLERHRCIKVLNEDNYGPVTLFRVYPPNVDPEEALDREFNDESYKDQLIANNLYNRKIFDLIHEKVMKGEGVVLSWTLGYRHANYENAPSISAMKSFITSPWTNLDSVDLAVDQVIQTRNQLLSENNNNNS